MNYNQRTNYRVSRETALGWWKAMPADGFQVCGVTGEVGEVRAGKPEEGIRGQEGLWMILTFDRSSEVAAIVAQPLTDGSGEWGLAVLWYDREEYSRLARWLRASRLSRSRDVVTRIEKVVLQQGGRAFPRPAPSAK